MVDFKSLRKRAEDYGKKAQDLAQDYGKKAQDYVGEHNDAIDRNIDKAVDFAGRKVKNDGQRDKIGKAADKLKDALPDKPDQPGTSGTGGGGTA